MYMIELEDGPVTEVDVQFMELDEINNLLTRIQAEIVKCSDEKRKLSTLPLCKKDGKTLKKVTRLTSRLSELQLAQGWIGRVRKQKRDTQQKERDWYRCWMKIAKDSIRKGLFEKITEQTNIKMQYSI